MARSEFEEQYEAQVRGEEREIESALLGQPVGMLAPAAPILVKRDMSVREAIRKMQDTHQGAVVVVDDEGRLEGIFSERDVLRRVVGKDLDVTRTPVGQVMTAKPEAIRADSRIVYALHKMSVGGFRNLPIVDDDGKPVGIVFTRHFVKFIVSLFPDAVMNLPPEETLKHPTRMAGG